MPAAGAPRPTVQAAAEQAADEQAWWAEQVRAEHLEEAERRRKRFAVSIGGSGVALVVIGAALGYNARTAWRLAAERCDGTPERCPAPAVYSANLDRDLAQRAAGRANWAFGIGGVALAGGILLYLTAPRAPDTRRVMRVVPTIDRDAVGLTVAGVLR